MKSNVGSKMTKTSWKAPSKTLVEILDKHGVNGYDLQGGTDKATVHNYTGIYEHLLKPFKDRRYGALLEIGVRHGGSSLLWWEYLPNFQFALVDPVITFGKNIVEIFNKDMERYLFYNTDAYTDECKQNLKEDWEKFDVIIDDGPHTPYSQKWAIENYLELVEDDGLLIIEDIESNTVLEMLKESVPEEYKSNIEVYDVREISGRYDDLILVVRK